MPLRDWTLGAVLQYGSGLPIQAPLSPANNNASTLLRSTYATRVPGVPLYLVDINCHCYDPSETQVLNPAAWTNTPNGQFSPSAAYYNDYRYQRRPSELASFGRTFRLKEKRLACDPRGVQQRLQPDAAAGRDGRHVCQSRAPLCGTRRSTRVPMAAIPAVSEPSTRRVRSAENGKGTLVARITF